MHKNLQPESYHAATKVSRVCICRVKYFQRVPPSGCHLEDFSNW